MLNSLYAQAYRFFINTLREGSYYGDAYYISRGTVHYGGDLRMMSFFQDECEVVDNILNGNHTSKSTYSHKTMIKSVEETVTPAMVRRCVNALKAYTHSVDGYYLPGINELTLDDVLEIYQASVDAVHNAREEKGYDVLSMEA